MSDNPRHVLIVEDDQVIRDMVSDLLADAGFGVSQAEDGVEALRLLRDAHPDLILLDLMLPRMSGWQFLERSRARLERTNTPVLILSAIKGQGDYPSTLGVAAWLTKPLDIDRLLSAVNDLAAARPDAAAPRAGQPARPVLVVEDDPRIRDLLDEHLSSAGYEVTAISTLAEATEAPQERLREAKDLGADAFLSKPFDFDVLSSPVGSLLLSG